MILTQDNEYAAVLDACALVPMSLCDTLLRLAEDPAMYRPLWSEEILREVDSTLQNKLKLTSGQAKRRMDSMRQAFPEAIVTIPPGLVKALEGIPDKDDRHVLAVAIRAHANVIVTQNIKHFPESEINQYGILCHAPDDFLIHQFHLSPLQVLDKLDAQASAISQGRPEIVSSLRKVVPGFIELVEKWTSG